MKTSTTSVLVQKIILSAVVLVVLNFLTTERAVARGSNDIQKTQKTILDCHLPAPQNLKITVATCPTLAAQWDNVDGNAGYVAKLFLVLDGGVLAAQPVFSSVVNASMVQFDGVEHGRYRLVVAAICPDGSSLGNGISQRDASTGSPASANSIIHDDLAFLIKPVGFTGSMAVTYEVPKGNPPVSLDVFDANGNAAATVQRNVPTAAGRYERVVNTEGVKTGLYVIRLQIGDRVKTQKFVRMKE